MALILSKPLFLLAIVITTLLLDLPFSNSLSFNFSDFAQTPDITLERAFRRDGAIVLVNTNMAVGRATYSKPLRLWDNSTGRVTDFVSRFKFVIDADNRTYYGDGMAFFLAVQGSLNGSMDNARGGALGLIESDQRLNVSKDKAFVAVEFDIYKNGGYDPVGEHVGIDVSSMLSVDNVTWKCNLRDGIMNEALVVYSSTTQELSVNFTGFVGDYNNVTIWQFLSHKVDFKSVLPEEVTFGFTAGTGADYASFSVHSWEFESTLEIAEAPRNSTTSSGEKKSNIGIVLGFCVGGLVLVFGFCLILFLWKKKKGNQTEAQMMDKFWDDEFQKGTGPKKFSYDELARATSNFKEDSKLGQGGFGGVYKGFLPDLNAYVAVKRVSKGSSQGMKEYAAEVKIISKLRHRNLVQLLGWCHSEGDLLLVYEYMPNGSLDSHLFKEKYNLLSWDNRYKIAQGLASALLYLHEEWDQCVIHRDIKSSNVMLDSNFNAKLGDFGLATLMDHSKGCQTISNVAGTPGYMAPEFFITFKASKETDIYSFGVVCLELACGRKPTNTKASMDQTEMVEWVWELYGTDEILEAADPRLSGKAFDKQQMVCLMIVGLWCAHPDYNKRPSISQALDVLSFKNELPNLPPKMPVPTYNVTPVSMLNGTK